MDEHGKNPAENGEFYPTGEQLFDFKLNENLTERENRHDEKRTS